MAKYSTNSLLDLCRNGVSLKNEKSDTAARELLSFIVFASLLEHVSDLPAELDERVVILQDAQQSPEKYPQDIFDEDEEVDPAPEGDGPQVA